MTLFFYQIILVYKVIILYLCYLNENEMRRLVLNSAYNRFNVALTEDDMCVIETRDSHSEITINEAIEKFSATTTSSGILSAYIFDTETKVSTKIPTQWDSIRLAQREVQRRLITQQIERLQLQLQNLN